jgi:hypothetical protein
MSRCADLKNRQLIALCVEIIRQHRNGYRLILDGDCQVGGGIWRIRPNRAAKPLARQKGHPSADRKASSQSAQNIHFGNRRKLSRPQSNNWKLSTNILSVTFRVENAISLFNARFPPAQWQSGERQWSQQWSQ